MNKHTATKSEILVMLREYWETRPRGEKREETAARIGVSKSFVAAVLAGTRKDLGLMIPAFFGYEKPADEIYVKTKESKARD